MSQQSRGAPVVKQEHVNPQMVFSQQLQQQQQQQQQQQRHQQQQQRHPQQQSSRPTPMMFMQPNSSSALQHQYINDDSLAGSSTFADNELAESLGGYGNLTVDPFTYTPNGNGFNDNTSFDAEHNGGLNQHRASTGGKSFPLRLQQTNPLYAASPSDFASFSPEFGSPPPAPIPFNRSRPGQMTSMSMPQFGGANAHHAAMIIGAGSLTASPSTPGFVGSFGGAALGYADMDGADAAKSQAALKEKRQKRRESHNAVERRRRDNINEKIQELAAIIPDEFMTPSSIIHGGASSPLSASPATHHAPDGTIKHNKGVILRKSVDYIRSLQDVVKESQRRARRLEEEVKRLGGDPKLVDHDESRRESLSNIEDDESWLDDALIGDDSPGMMMD